MSSHHVVRENQEPALLIDELSLSDANNLGPILEWSPTIIAEEQSIDLFDAWGVKLDIVFSRSAVSSTTQEHTRQVYYKTNFLEEALDYLVVNRYRAVNVVTSRVDFSIYKPFLDRINIVLLHGYKRYAFVKTDFVKWFPAGEAIEIFSDDKTLEVVGAGRIHERSYRMETDGLIEIRFAEEKYIMISENTI